MSAGTTLPINGTPASRKIANFWVWVHVAVAAIAMIATLPGRTHGLGLFTEPILKSTGIDRDLYGSINFWATLVGALFCLPVGWLIDRFGSRWVLLAITTALGATVITMSYWAKFNAMSLGLFISLTRGFGQSALSVVSLTLIAQSAGIRNGFRMGVYSALMSVGFVAAFGVLRELILTDKDEWRYPWGMIGTGVIICGIVCSLLLRSTLLKPNKSETNEGSRTNDRSLREALASGAFWVFAMGTSFYGMVVAGTSLFNESILSDRGFDKEIFLNITIVGIPIGLIANLGGGLLAARKKIGRLFAGAFAALAIALACFPAITQQWQVYAYATVLAGSGGIITVCFFSIWRREFGLTALGRIQGAAQLLTVLFSALGPKLFSFMKSEFGEYSLLFPYLAGSSGIIAMCAWFVPVTNSKPQGASR